MHDIRPERVLLSRTVPSRKSIKVAKIQILRVRLEKDLVGTIADRANLGPLRDAGSIGVSCEGRPKWPAFLIYRHR